MVCLFEADVNTVVYNVKGRPLRETSCGLLNKITSLGSVAAYGPKY